MGSVTVGILTVSDSCFRKEKDDISGRKLSDAVKVSSPDYKISFQEVVPDNKDCIARKLNEWVDAKCQLILTTGGTGFSPRDVTPEATRSVIEREAPGIIIGMISKSLAITPMAMLSRAVCGIKETTIIVNLPGSPKGATECFSFIESVIPHALALLADSTIIISKEHHKIQTNGNHSPSKVKVNNIASRSRSSLYPLVEVQNAKNILLKETRPTLRTELISVEDSLHRVLAEDIYSKDALPQFNASIKDGYAVLAADGAGPRAVKNFSAAGDNPAKTTLQSGEAVRVCTGAPVPEGADAVVQVEDTTLLKASEDGTEELEINIGVAPQHGQDIRLAGSDMAAGTKVLNKFDTISAGHIGVMAAVGKSKVKVFGRPSIGIISTGNELVDFRHELQPGEVRDSNKITLVNLFRRYHINANDYGIIKDKPNSLKAAIADAFVHCDVLVTTGGVSMGEFDLIKAILIEDFDAVIHFGRVNMKPGKPTTFATLDFNGRIKLFFGLPGNPVSACVTSLLFVIPTIRYMERRESFDFPEIRVRVSNLAVQGLINRDTRPEYVRVRISGNDHTATPTGDQISSRINSLVGANGLLILKRGVSNLLNSYSAILTDDL